MQEALWRCCGRSPQANPLHSTEVTCLIWKLNSPVEAGTCRRRFAFVADEARKLIPSCGGVALPGFWLCARAMAYRQSRGGCIPFHAVVGVITHHSWQLHGSFLRPSGLRLYVFHLLFALMQKVTKRSGYSNCMVCFYVLTDYVFMFFIYFLP